MEERVSGTCCNNDRIVCVIITYGSTINCKCGLGNSIEKELITVIIAINDDPKRSCRTPLHTIGVWVSIGTIRRRKAKSKGCGNFEKLCTWPVLKLISTRYVVILEGSYDMPTGI